MRRRNRFEKSHNSAFDCKRLSLEQLELRLALSTVVDWDDGDSHRWIGESFGGATNVVDWVSFDNRQALRSQVTSTENYTVVRTDNFPAENWRDNVALKADIYQVGGANGIDVKLEVSGTGLGETIDELFCNNVLQTNEWKTCTWTIDPGNQDFDSVSKLTLVFDNLNNTQPTFYVDNVRLVSAGGGEQEWDDMDDGSRNWFYGGNWFNWLSRSFGHDPVSHNGANPTTPAGSLFLEWDAPNGEAPGLDFAEVGTSQTEDMPDWSVYNRISADVKVSDADVPINVFLLDGAGIGFGTPSRKAGISDSWQTVTWDLPFPSSFDKTAIDQVKFAVTGIDQPAHAAGTLFVDNIALRSDPQPSAASGLEYRFAGFEREDDVTDFSSNFGELIGEFVTTTVDQATAAEDSRASLRVNYNLPAGQLTGTFFSLWGNSDCKQGGPPDRCSAPESIDFTDIFGATNEDKDFEQITFWVRGSGLTENVHNVKVELKDTSDQFENTAIRYITIDDNNTQWQQVVLDADVANEEFWSYNADAPDAHNMKFLVFVVESFFNEPTGTFYIDNIKFVDADDAPFDPAQNTDDTFLDLVSRRAFSYFVDWYEPTTGLFQDRSEFPDLASVAATGFGLTALTIGEQRGWIDRQVAIDMITRTLTTLRDGQSLADTVEDTITETNGYKGFYYHFLDTTGKRKDSGSELSSVDTALLLMGALTAKEHFSGVPQIEMLVNELYDRVEWDWMLDSSGDPKALGNDLFFHAWNPTLVPGKFEIAAPGGGFFSSAAGTQWDYSTDEVMLINILAIASSTHPVAADVFYAWERNLGSYGGHELVHSFNGSFFTYFFAHLWIDFQPLGHDNPPPGGPIAVDWWENSIQATLANQQFAIDHADNQVCDGDENYATYGVNSFGLTAADGFDPDGDGPLNPYHAFGALPTDPRTDPDHDGTIAPYGAGSAIIFQSDIAIAALKHYYTETEVWNSRLGFGDAFSLDFPDCNGPWYNHAVFGIDNGPLLIAIENHRSEFVWDTIQRNSNIAGALQQLFSDTDYGDAPDPTFATLVANDGAGHLLTSELFLGASVDGDPDGQPTATADGDDTDGNDDDDGVVVNGALIPGLNASLTVTVSDGPGNGAFLDAWLDLDGDGTWSHPGEQIIASRPVGHGANVITFPVDPGAVPGTTYARFRLSSAGGLEPTGIADDGEVEDYEFEIAAPRIFVVDSTGSGGDLTPGDGVCQDILGQCTLFAAIEEANASPNDAKNPDVIAFNIAGGGMHSIQSPLELPAITNAVVIDGTTQPGYAGLPLIELDGSLTASGTSGLTIRIAGGGTVIRGLAINRFPSRGIFVSRGDGNAIEQNHLGTNPAGTIDLGNGEAGVHVLNGENNTVFGNLISGNEMGVVVEGPLATGNVLQVNVIGASADGNSLKNRLVNVDVAAAPNNVIGGSGGLGNVVVGSKVGISIRGSQATGNVVSGNSIGHTLAGTAVVNNRGVEIKSSATNNTIGGPGDAGNVISGNTKGVLLSGVQNNLVHGNKIGTNADGNVALPNTRGVLISGGSNNQIGDEPNVISGNIREGVRIFGDDATGNVVRDNFIGTNADGTAAIPNRDGVLISPGADGNTIGGITVAARNVISGNTRSGIVLQSDDNSVVGNFIGTDAAGTSAIGNETGVLIDRGVSNNTIGGPVGSGAGNVISGNTEEGVHISGGATANTVTGNVVGTDSTGMTAVGNKHGVLIESAANIVGGAAASDGNVISGNTQNGVYLDGMAATGNMVRNNRIGINIDGSGPVANARSGVLIQDAADNTIGGAGSGNAIGGNTQQGIRIAGADATGNTVEGNSIGLDRVTMTAIANRDGVRITDEASNNLIGGTVAGEGNEIAYNTARGVWITSGMGNTIARNSIHDNGRLGIDLSPSGNNLQNAPNLTAAISSGGFTTVTGTLNSTANSTFTIEFFSSPVADPSGFGEGETFLGSAVVNTNGGGDGNFAPSFSVDVPSGHFVTATATDDGGSTSEFSAVQPVSSMLQAAAGTAAARQAGGSPAGVSAARPAGGSPAGVSVNELQPVVNAAIDRLVAAGFAAELFANVELAIADLPGATLGLTTGNTITIDINAAGYGWFVSQETRVKGQEPEDADANSGSRLSTLDPRLRFDLLTVVMHELGHLAGLEDLYDSEDADDLMAAWLTPGLRRTATELADAAFAET